MPKPRTSLNGDGVAVKSQAHMSDHTNNPVRVIMNATDIVLSSDTIALGKTARKKRNEDVMIFAHNVDTVSTI